MAIKFIIKFIKFIKQYHWKWSRVHVFTLLAAGKWLAVSENTYFYTDSCTCSEQSFRTVRAPFSKGGLTQWEISLCLSPLHCLSPFLKRGRNSMGKLALFEPFCSKLSPSYLDLNYMFKSNYNYLAVLNYMLGNYYHTAGEYYRHIIDIKDTASRRTHYTALISCQIHCTIRLIYTALNYTENRQFSLHCPQL